MLRQQIDLLVTIDLKVRELRAVALREPAYLETQQLEPLWIQPPLYHDARDKPTIADDGRLVVRRLVAVITAHYLGSFHGFPTLNP